MLLGFPTTHKNPSARNGPGGVAIRSPRSHRDQPDGEVYCDWVGHIVAPILAASSTALRTYALSMESIAAAASPCIAGIKCEYVSSVSVIVECPSISETSLT
jgi:hypothetical protein